MRLGHARVDGLTHPIEEKVDGVLRGVVDKLTGRAADEGGQGTQLVHDHH